MSPQHWTFPFHPLTSHTAFELYAKCIITTTEAQFLEIKTLETILLVPDRFCQCSKEQRIREGEVPAHAITVVRDIKDGGIDGSNLHVGDCEVPQINLRRKLLSKSTEERLLVVTSYSPLPSESAGRHRGSRGYEAPQWCRSNSCSDDPPSPTRCRCSH